MNKKITFHIEGKEKSVEVTKAYCIGYSGRNQEKVMEHIKELEEIGVPEPEEIPALYPVRLSTLTQGPAIEVLGEQTGGEAEIVLIFGETSDDVWLTVGSDHTDRGLETVDINKSKQVCDKPFAEKAWLFQDVIDHWDQLILSSFVRINNEWVPYQEQTVQSILHPENILDFLSKKNIELTKSIFFTGTVPLKDGFKYGDKFSMKLIDPVRNDEITWEYGILHL
jgi:2-keto-4-pentenoate hydratase/2-oxohepta-3-ene-1,7-dioic acid hydratase in catechol pathway